MLWPPAGLIEDEDELDELSGETDRRLQPTRLRLA
jgi:hypothetical protein